jgi:hypothetical protein
VGGAVVREGSGALGVFSLALNLFGGTPKKGTRDAVRSKEGKAALGVARWP